MKNVQITANLFFVKASVERSLQNLQNSKKREYHESLFSAITTINAVLIDDWRQRLATWQAENYAAIAFSQSIPSKKTKRFLLEQDLVKSDLKFSKPILLLLTHPSIGALKGKQLGHDRDIQLYDRSEPLAAIINARSAMLPPSVWNCKVAIFEDEPELVLKRSKSRADKRKVAFEQQNEIPAGYIDRIQTRKFFTWSELKINEKIAYDDRGYAEGPGERLLAQAFGGEKAGPHESYDLILPTSMNVADRFEVKSVDKIYGQFRVGAKHGLAATAKFRRSMASAFAVAELFVESCQQHSHVYLRQLLTKFINEKSQRLTANCSVSNESLAEMIDIFSRAKTDRDNTQKIRMSLVNSLSVCKAESDLAIPEVAKLFPRNVRPALMLGHPIFQNAREYVMNALETITPLQSFSNVNGLIVISREGMCRLESAEFDECLELMGISEGRPNYRLRPDAVQGF